MRALHGKAVELAETEPVEAFQRVGYRHAGNEEASPFPADGSDAASLPKAPDEEPVVVKVPSVREGTHLRLMHVKR